jgi:hypothetical protein
MLRNGLRVCHQAVDRYQCADAGKQSKQGKEDNRRCIRQYAVIGDTGDDSPENILPAARRNLRRSVGRPAVIIGARRRSLISDRRRARFSHQAGQHARKEGRPQRCVVIRDFWPASKLSAAHRSATES